MKKIILYVLSGIILLIVMGISYLSFALPNTGLPEEIALDVTPEMLERGKYLANHVALCTDCHSERDFTFFAGPIIEETFGQGGEVFDETLGFPGRYISPNITSHENGIGDWTDGEVFRAITEGVTKEGDALFPVMPYPHYGAVDREDILAIQAYIRTLPPKEEIQEESRSNFPVNFLINTMPIDAKFTKRPSMSDTVAYGAYMFKLGGCTECHTPMDKGVMIDSLYLAGGLAFPMSTGGVARAANITPDVETGIGSWSKEQFIQRFKQYTDSAYVNPRVKPGTFNTFMPWLQYAHMKEHDLAAIYEYLRTVKPVNRAIEKFTPPVQ